MMLPTLRLNVSSCCFSCEYIPKVFVTFFFSEADKRQPLKTNHVGFDQNQNAGCLVPLPFCLEVMRCETEMDRKQRKVESGRNSLTYDSSHTCYKSRWHFAT